MGKRFLLYYIRAQEFLKTLKADDGQDLVEYALVIAVVCLGIISGMSTLANGINNAMTVLSGSLSNAVS